MSDVKMKGCPQGAWQPVQQVSIAPVGCVHLQSHTPNVWASVAPTWPLDPPHSEASLIWSLLTPRPSGFDAYTTANLVNHC